ncbi:MAG: class I SAM-dependent methyltransferase [Anaerolineae bacterium]
MHTTTKHADYGIDAPTVVRNLGVAGISALLLGSGFAYLLHSIQSLVALLLGAWGLLAGGSMLATSALMIWSSKVGKLREREKLLDTIQWRGDETVLDVGCGRGLLLNAAAKRIPNGKAVGVDIWQAQDQSGNLPENTIANAQAEGTATRVELKDGDMRRLPFADSAFDVVVSSLALHNIYDTAERQQAVHEIARVLKSGGHLALLDFQHVDEYADVLRALGWESVQVSNTHFGMFPPVKWVTGTKR